MSVVQISPKGQILIPKKIREKYSIKPGKIALVIESSEGILIKSAPEDPIEAACGFLDGSIALSKELIEDHKKESKRYGKSHSR
jgi:AbrB family looped-hinge helix DNA binding protein